MDWAEARSDYGKTVLLTFNNNKTFIINVNNNNGRIKTVKAHTHALRKFFNTSLTLELKVKIATCETHVHPQTRRPLAQTSPATAKVSAPNRHTRTNVRATL
jgi:hypothetical protein